MGERERNVHPDAHAAHGRRRARARCRDRERVRSAGRHGRALAVVRGSPAAAVVERARRAGRVRAFRPGVSRRVPVSRRGSGADAAAARGVAAARASQAELAAARDRERRGVRRTVAQARRATRVRDPPFARRRTAMNRAFLYCLLLPALHGAFDDAPAPKPVADWLSEAKKHAPALNELVGAKSDGPAARIVIVGRAFSGTVELAQFEGSVASNAKATDVIALDVGPRQGEQIDHWLRTGSGKLDEIVGSAAA